MMLALILAASFSSMKPAPAPPSDLTKPPADAQKSADGLVSKQLEAGKSDQHPNMDDYVHVRYAVWKASDGSIVDYTRTEVPSFIGMSKLLPGMREMFE